MDDLAKASWRSLAVLKHDVHNFRGTINPTWLNESFNHVALESFLKE